MSEPSPVLSQTQRDRRTSGDRSRFLRSFRCQLPTLIVSLIFAGLIGLINGALIAFLNLPPFIATLGTQMVTLGLGSIITNVQTQRFPTVGTSDEWFKQVFYRADLFGVKGFPIGAVYLFAAFFIAIRVIIAIS